MIFSINNFKWSFLLGLQIVSYGSYTILVRLCPKDGNGFVLFNATEMNFIIELMKLFASIFSHFVYHFSNKNIGIYAERSDGEKFYNQLKLKNSLYFAIPGLLYFVNNNLAVQIQSYMDSSSYQVLSNFKIFTTAIIYYLIMKRKLSRLKCFSLILLFSAGILYVCGNYKEADGNVSNKDRFEDEIYITELGILLMLVYCSISGLAGVYTEFILKANIADSIFIQNIYLYIYGCVFNAVGCFIETKLDNRHTEMGFLKGFNFYTWIIVISQVYNGLAMSVLMKYSNNISKLFVISSSLVVTTILSVMIFSLKLNVFFYILFFVIILAFYLYFYVDNK